MPLRARTCGSCLALLISLLGSGAHGQSMTGSTATTTQVPSGQVDAAARARMQQQLELLRRGGIRGAGAMSPTVNSPASPAAPLAAQPAVAAQPLPQGTAAAAPASASTHTVFSTGTSLLDQPPTPASISFANDQLTVVANNASLDTTLRAIGSRTGMQIDGLQHDLRFFGTYGPGRPADVLTSLLDGSGYNVMMVGTDADGAPRHLVLSTRSAAPANGSAAVASTERSQDDEDDGTANDPPQSPAALFARPETTPPASTPNPNQPRTPQQMLEELQRLRQGQTGSMGQQDEQQQPEPSSPNQP
jgi:hypothetical protein